MPPAAPDTCSTCAEACEAISEAQFVEMRKARDATLEVPALILPSIQVNIRAGQLPPPEDDGVSYLKIPLDVLGEKVRK